MPWTILMSYCSVESKASTLAPLMESASPGSRSIRWMSAARSARKTSPRPVIFISGTPSPVSFCLRNLPMPPEPSACELHLALVGDHRAGAGHALAVELDLEHLGVLQPQARAGPTPSPGSPRRTARCASGVPPRRVVTPEVGSRATAVDQRRNRLTVRPAQPQPSSCRRSSSMPKWWAISCTTVIATSSTTSSSVSQIAQGRAAVDGDPVGQHAGVVPAAVGQRVPLVEAEQVRLARWRVVLDQDHHVVHQAEQLGGHLVERVADQFLEALTAHLDRHGSIVPLRGPAEPKTTGCQASLAVRVISAPGRAGGRSGSSPWRPRRSSGTRPSSMPGTSPTVSRSIRVTVMPASVLSRCTLAVVSTEVGGEAGVGEALGERHREAAGVRGADQLLGVGALALLEAGLEASSSPRSRPCRCGWCRNLR